MNLIICHETISISLCFQISKSINQHFIHRTLIYSLLVSLLLLYCNQNQILFNTKPKRVARYPTKAKENIGAKYCSPWSYTGIRSKASKNNLSCLLEKSNKTRIQRIPVTKANMQPFFFKCNDQISTFNLII